MTYTEAMLQVFTNLIRLLDQAIANYTESNHTEYLEVLNKCKKELNEQHQVCQLKVNYTGALDMNVFEELCLFLQNFKNKICKIPPEEKAKEFSSSIFSFIYHLMAEPLSNAVDFDFLSYMLTDSSIGRLAFVDSPPDLKGLLLALIERYRQQNKTLNFVYYLHLLDESEALAKKSYVDALASHPVEYTQGDEIRLIRLGARLEIEKSFRNKIKIIMCYTNLLHESYKEEYIVKTLKQTAIKFFQRQVLSGNLDKSKVEQLPIPSDLLEEITSICLNKP